MKYHIYKNNQQFGPLDESEVQSRLRSRALSPDDLACRVGDEKWRPLSDFFPLHTDFPGTRRQESGNLPPGKDPFTNYRDPANQAGAHQRPPQQSAYQPPPQQSAYRPPPQQSAWHAPSAPVQHVVHHYTEQPEGSLPTIAMTAGIVIACLMVLGLVPCLGWLNWFVIFGGVVTKVICWVSVLTEQNRKSRNKALIGLILVSLALFIGSIRLVLGSGCV